MKAEVICFNHAPGGCPIFMYALFCLFLCLPSCAADEALFDRYNQQGMKAYRDGNDAEAERLLRLAAAEAERFSADDPRVEKTLRNLSTVCIDQGKLTEAKDVLSKSLLIKEKAYGKGSKESATTLNDLGVLCFQLGKYAESEQYFLRVLDMDDKNLPPNHPERATTLQNYAQMLRKTKRYADAERMEARAAQILANPPRARE